MKTTEVGIENLHFVGKWYENFKHHKNDYHDYAFNALAFFGVKNCWTKNLRFTDLNNGIFVKRSFLTTFNKLKFDGNGGHYGVGFTKGGHNYVTNIQEKAGHEHGVSFGYGNSMSVARNIKVTNKQRFDMHSGSTYATLIENWKGGTFNGNGGKEYTFPHHLKHLVIWGFKHGPEKRNYNFWYSGKYKRQNHYFYKPIIVGFQSKWNVKLKNVGKQERNEKSPGKSLYQMQRDLRKYLGY